MKTQIHITGQISGNFTLVRLMQNYESKRQGMFNSFILEYRTKTEARNDLKNAYKQLKRDEPDTCNLDIYRYKGKPISVTYDASRAEII
jgi:hypothetical protein